MIEKMQNKQEFITTISEVGGITKKDAGSILELVLASVQKACKEDGGVSIVGVGKVEVKDVAAKSGEMNGKAWSTPATKTIKVKVAKTFVEKTLEV